MKSCCPRAIAEEVAKLRAFYKGRESAARATEFPIVEAAGYRRGQEAQIMRDPTAMDFKDDAIGCLEDWIAAMKDPNGEGFKCMLDSFRSGLEALRREGPAATLFLTEKGESSRPPR